MMMHSLLERQLRTLNLSMDALPGELAGWRAFLDAVGAAYRQCDSDRELLEMSLDLTSREMRQLYDEVERHNEQLETEVAARTAELEVANARDRQRMDELEDIVEARTVELRHAALHDKLTGLPNRSMFYDRLYHVIRRRRRNPDLVFAVLFIDFDKFKSINDSLGHAAGDALLRAIASRLQEGLRATDTICSAKAPEFLAARLGGDEFCILLEDLKNDGDAKIVADRLLRRLSDPYDLDDRCVTSTASIGIAHSCVGYETAEDMIRDADIAMYRAKRLGRGRVVQFDQEMHGTTMRQIDIESDIKRAAENNELYLVYQPIVSLVTGCAIAVETLCRWRHPVYGEISPEEFIPLAEELGVIDSIGLWVLDTAVAQFAQWRAQWTARTPLSFLTVNVSPAQLTGDELRTHVEQALGRHSLDPASLVLEITETTLMRNAVESLAAIQSIRDLGARFFLDDFGSGYSSLGILHEFPLDGIKLDRAFLESATSTRRVAACIHSVVTLARTLNMDLIAEGIESYQQVALLQSLGCEDGQGYLFSPPMRAESLPEGLASISPDTWRREALVSADAGKKPGPAAEVRPRRSPPRPIGGGAGAPRAS
ncbi:MAG TPA: EAL domain-containing protein [Phycisphaerae bacterium]|nr:EAL domain-containing protein [Phycisphaerae bacterium]